MSWLFFYAQRISQPSFTAFLPYICKKSPFDRVVDHSIDNFSNEQLINGLRTADQSALEAVYASFRPAVIRNLSSFGASDASGKVFFRIAVVEAAGLAQAEILAPDEPLYDQIRALALAHYSDWLAEKGQPVPDIPQETAEGKPALDLPDSQALRNTREKIDSWKKSERTDEPGFGVWEKIREIERKLSGDQKMPPQSNLARNLLIFFLLLTLGYVVYQYFNRSKTPGEVYKENFTPPASLMDDLARRYGAERGNDSVTARPNACEYLLRQADEYYKNKDMEAAQTALFEILDDSLSVCHSDALFYIGVIALEQEKPGLALECFSKIDDLEHFGEDIYWYQALAMVQLAKGNPLLESKARRAVERARSNARDSLRREQAERILKQMSD